MRYAWVAIGLAGSLLARAGGIPDPAGTAGSAAATETRTGANEVQSLLSSGREAIAGRKWAEAIALFEKVRKLEPENNECRFGLSVALIESERFSEALPLLEELRMVVPNNPMVMNNLAWVYTKSQDPAIRRPAEAVKLARAAMLAQPADYSIWNTLAEAYYAQGEYASALRAAQSALRLCRLAGVTNDAAYSELVSRCRLAAGSP